MTPPDLSAHKYVKKFGTLCIYYMVYIIYSVFIFISSSKYLKKYIRYEIMFQMEFLDKGAKKDMKLLFFKNKIMILFT